MRRGRLEQRRRAASVRASSTSSSIERFGTSSRMRSPVRTSASGPPTAASGVTCSTMVPNAVPLMRASEMRTMSFTPCSRELLRDRDVAGLGHARRALRAGIAQHQHVVGRHVERRVVDARRPCPRAYSNTTARPSCFISFGVAADCLMIAPRGARLPRSTAMPPCGLIGFARGRITSCPSTCSARVDLLAQRAAGDGQRVEVRAAAELAQQRAARRRPGGSPPCSARPRASGRPAPAPRGRCASNASRSIVMPSAARDRGEMDDAVGRAADRQQHAQRVRERRARS